jgi:hypothetical protein
MAESGFNHLQPYVKSLQAGGDRSSQIVQCLVWQFFSTREGEVAVQG